MEYVGNTSLSPQIQERILNTFQQTLSLAQEGNRQEALLGCDFVLRLDPLFEPARRLQERLREGDGAVDVEDLSPFGGAVPSVAESEPEAAAQEVDGLEVLEPSPELAAELTVESSPEPAAELTVEPSPEPAAELTVEPSPEPAAEPTVEPSVTEELPGRLAMLVEQRDFQAAVELAGEHRDHLAQNAELRQLVELATARLEAEPYVKNFLEFTRKSLEAGDLEAARGHLDKARELDDSHPGIAALEGDLAAAGDESLELEVLEPSADEEEPAGPTLEEPEELAVQPVPALDSEPSARLDSESEQRIEELLAEGQQGFDDGEYQAAIDAWSRIFLIDIDHAEASRRIELARKLKAEVERQIEETFHEGMSLLEAGNLEGAREALEKVVEMQPNHLGARDYLEKLESGDLTPRKAKAAEGAPIETPEPIAEEPEAELDVEDVELAPELTEAVAPPEAIPPIAVEARPAAAPRKRSFALIGSAVLVALLAVAWFVYSKWDRIFPASTAQEAAAPSPRVDPIERARELHEAGNTAMAINVLKRLPPGHAQNAEAQSLIALWETGDEPVEPAPVKGPTERDLARRGQLIELAREASQQGENLRALELLDRASRIEKLEGTELEMRILASDMLEDLREELQLFQQGDWEYALPNLWRLHDADPQNPDVVRLMVDSYYNLGLRDLQRGDPRAAMEKLKEALNLLPDDSDVQRLADFAAAYEQRPADLLYRIFVKYQHFR